MNYIIAGLGNTGEEYKDTRHNVGRIMVERFRVLYDFPEWQEDKKRGALVSKGMIGKHSVTLILPELLMNRSGAVLAHFATSKKKAEKLVVVYDDIDLGFGAQKMSFGRGSGGHRGVESVIKKLSTKDFIRLRVGVSPTTPKGAVKKPKGEEKVLHFLMGKFNKREQSELTKIGKQVSMTLSSIVENGYIKAMNECNRG